MNFSEEATNLSSLYKFNVWKMTCIDILFDYSSSKSYFFFFFFSSWPRSVYFGYIVEKKFFVYLFLDSVIEIF